MNGETISIPPSSLHHLLQPTLSLSPQNLGALPSTSSRQLSPSATRCSSFHDHKDDLRKRLSYTAHKLEMVETEFDSTRQYLETELRRAQEELEKFTEKLRR